MPGPQASVPLKRDCPVTLSPGEDLQCGLCEEHPLPLCSARPGPPGLGNAGCQSSSANRSVFGSCSLRSPLGCFEAERSQGLSEEALPHLWITFTQVKCCLTPRHSTRAVTHLDRFWRPKAMLLTPLPEC